MPSDPRDPVGPVRAADALGGASIALGLVTLLTPRRTLRLIGVRPEPAPAWATRAVGARELLAATTILGMHHRRVGAWSRVGGDVLDIALLGLALRHRRRQVARMAAAGAFLGGILALDLSVARALNAAEGVDIEDGSSSSGEGFSPPEPAGPLHLRTAITINQPLEDVRRRFHEFDWKAFDAGEVEQAGSVRFEPAPGERGVELHLDYEFSAPAGALGAAAMKLVGQSPDQRIIDDLRRFKAVIETGEEPRSDKTPEGHSAFGQIFQRPGQPIGAGH